MIRLRFAAALAVPALLLACSSEGGGEVHENDPAFAESTGTSTEALTTVTRSQSIALAQQWVTAKLQYCQAANGAHDYDTACSSVCHRESNVAWDPYRSDCSGFISWAWELPAPGRVTSTFAPFDTTVSKTVSCTDLKPGDAANKNAGGHIVLFEKWITPGEKAVFLEEPGCSSATPYAHEFTSAVACDGVNISIDYEGETFTAIRYVNIVDDPPTTGGGSGGDPGRNPAGGKAPGDANSPADPGATGDGAGAGDPGTSPQGSPAIESSSGCGVSPASRSSSGWGGVFMIGALALVRRRRGARARVAR